MSASIRVDLDSPSARCNKGTSLSFPSSPSPFPGWCWDILIASARCFKRDAPGHFAEMRRFHFIARANKVRKMERAQLERRWAWRSCVGVLLKLLNSLYICTEFFFCEHFGEKLFRNLKKNIFFSPSLHYEGNAKGYVSWSGSNGIRLVSSEYYLIWHQRPGIYAETILSVFITVNCNKVAAYNSIYCSDFIFLYAYNCIQHI